MGQMEPVEIVGIVQVYIKLFQDLLLDRQLIDESEPDGGYEDA